MRNPTTGARRCQPIGHLLAQMRHWPRGSGTAAFHPQRASEQLPPQLGERLHSSDGEAAWNDSHGRNSVVQRLETALWQTTQPSHRNCAAGTSVGAQARCLRQMN